MITTVTQYTALNPRNQTNAFRNPRVADRAFEACTGITIIMINTERSRSLLIGSRNSSTWHARFAFQRATFRSQIGPLMRVFPLVLLCLLACRKTSEAAEPSVAKGQAAAVAPQVPKIVEPVYSGKLQSGWLDYGWSPRDVGHGHLKVDLSNYGGWIAGKPGEKKGLGGLVFSVSAFAASRVEVRLEGQGPFPKIALEPLTPVSQTDGLTKFFVPMTALDPRGVDFEQVVFQGLEKGPLKDVQLDDIAFTAEPAAAPVASGPSVEVKLSVDCNAAPKAISPFIYGVAFDPQRPNDDSAASIHATARRWGGNPASRYNWQKNAWNAGSDWYFHNLEYTGIKNFSYETFFSQQQVLGFKTALTVPLLGWVAKDDKACSFPLALYTKQDKLDPSDPACGNGKLDGVDLTPPSQSLTSVEAKPELMQKWVETIRAKDKESGRGRAVHLYYLDNEPNLWSTTHRDVHPEPLSYDELWNKTVEYARAIRKADPDAVIAGPAEWGWTGYMYSATDIKSGGTFIRPDRRRHEDLPLIAWYLKKAAEHEKKTGERLIDVLDLHFYPQAHDIGIGDTGKTDPQTSALRLRTTRALWDPGYKDESWIAEPIKLIPRMKEWIDTYYPGRGISIGEYNFGADMHPSGGLAQAEALGRFGQYGVGWAFVWYYPPKGSAGAQGFNAFRDYDGKGSRFLDLSAPAKSNNQSVSVFASRSDDGKKLVLVLLNLDPTHPASANVDVSSCGAVSASKAYQTTFQPKGYELVKTPKPDHASLPPYSITVLELDTAGKK